MDSTRNQVLAKKEVTEIRDLLNIYIKQLTVPILTRDDEQRLGRIICAETQEAYDSLISGATVPFHDYYLEILAGRYAKVKIKYDSVKEGLNGDLDKRVIALRKFYEKERFFYHGFLYSLAKFYDTYPFWYGNLKKNSRTDRAKQAERIVDFSEATHTIKESLDEAYPAMKKAYDHVADNSAVAKNKMVTANLRFVLQIAAEYARKMYVTKVPLLDLIQEGNIGLMKAAEKFDYTRGFKFSTYAADWIKLYIQNFIKNMRFDNVIHVPKDISADISTIRRIEQILTKQLKKEPSIEELIECTVEMLKIDSDYAKELVMLKINEANVYLDAPYGETGLRRRIDLLISDDDVNRLDALANAELRDILETALSTLNPRSQQIMRMRYHLNGDDKDDKLLDRSIIGKQLGINRERVRQLENKGKETLRNGRYGNRLRQFL